MSDFALLVAYSVVIGTGGAALMDLWELLARRAFNLWTPDGWPRRHSSYALRPASVSVWLRRP